MPRVSRYTLSPHQTEQLFSYFTYLISFLHNEDQIKNFLDEFLTIEEKNMLAKRLALFVMLEQKTPPPTIRAALSMSKETVRIYHQQFSFKSNMFHKTISHLLNSQKMKNFLTKSGEILHTIVTSKTNMKSRYKLLTPH